MYKIQLYSKKIILILKSNVFSITGLLFNKTSTKKYFNNGKSPLLQNSKEINNLFYSDLYAVNQYLIQERLDFYKNIVRMIEFEHINLNNKNIIDIGCGTGHLLWFIHKKFKQCQINGFDFSSSAIFYAKNLIKDGFFFVSDIYKKHGKKYDFVLCTEVLEHLEYPDRALKNIYSLLNVGGICLITIPNGRFDTLEEHINFWSPESWKIFVNSVLNHKRYKVKIKSKFKEPIYTFITKKND